MTTRLPLVAAQPGIWMAERACRTLPGAWSVAHYVELRGALDPTLPKSDCRRSAAGGHPQPAFEEEDGEVWQWLDADRTFAEPSIIDLRTAPDPHRAARSGCRRIWRRICASTAATRWCAISCCASATTAGTGISVITTCWWMASASRR